MALIERIYPWIAGVLTLVLGILCTRLQLSSITLAHDAIAVSATGIGFIAALMGILLSINSAPIRYLKKIKKFAIVVRYLLTSIPSVP